MSRAYDRAVRKLEAEDRARLQRASERLASDPDLRFFLWQVLDACGMAADPFTGDPLTTAHACGKMAVGTELLTLLSQFAPDLYPALLSEMHNEQRTRNAELNNRLSDGGD